MLKPISPAAPPIPVPRLRGVFHQWLLVVLVPAVVVLIAVAPPRARLPASVYGISLLACITVSALYHRVHWSPPAKRRMSKLDHSTIFLLIAGTFTPVSALALTGTLRAVTVIFVWSGAALGTALNLFRPDWPRAVEVAPFLVTPAVGWFDIGALFHAAGPAPTVLILIGGVLYILGAVVYARHSPNPWPRTFGFHEIFHVCVVAAATCHYIAVIGWVDPLGA